MKNLREIQNAKIAASCAAAKVYRQQRTMLQAETSHAAQPVRIASTAENIVDGRTKYLRRAGRSEWTPLEALRNE